jgi:ribonucleotide reductase beta subunit family protein with ferritin-like domain
MTQLKEPLLEESNRYTLFPIQYLDMWNSYNNHKNAFWTAQEIDYTADLDDWKHLNEDEKFFIENILAFFAGSDGIVLENLVEDFCSQVKIPEARCFYGFQAMMENIHCVSGDTKILTDKGYFNIQDLENQKINVWNGEEFSRNVEVKATGNQPLYRVELSNGMELDCTSGHKWLIGKETMVKIETKNLKVGDVIHEYKLPVINEGKLNHNLVVNQNEKSTLKEIQLMLTTMGLFSKIQKTDTGYTLSINDKNEKYEDIIILKIEKISDDSKTFCFNEPLKHTGVFNGILTGQSETYSLLIETFVKNPKRKKELFEAIDTIPAVSRKAQWALKWINKDIPFSTRLIAFAIVEGVFFSGSFCSIFWLKNRGKMVKSLGMANDFIARDEGLHTNFAVLLYKNHIVNKMSKEDFNNMMQEAVEIEREFICDSLPCNLIGMNSVLMYEYIKFVADRLSQQLGYEKIYNVDNPFPFMETIGLDGMGNFFEGRVSEYTSASSVIKQEDKHFVLSEDFLIYEDLIFFIEKKY